MELLVSCLFGLCLGVNVQNAWGQGYKFYVALVASVGAYVLYFVRLALAT